VSAALDFGFGGIAGELQIPVVVCANTRPKNNRPRPGTTQFFDCAAGAVSAFSYGQQRSENAGGRVMGAGKSLASLSGYVRSGAFEATLETPGGLSHVEDPDHNCCIDREC
jgi:hypothetical protein